MINFELDEMEIDEQSESFVIDNHEKADWAIRKIKEERERRDIYKTVADSEIERLKQKKAEADTKCDQRTSGLLSALNAYLDTVPAKETKTQRAFELPSGKIVRKLAAMDYDFDDAELLDYLRTDAPEYVKVTEKPAWGEFKKDLQIVGGVVIRKSTGVLVEQIHAVEKPESVEVK